MFIICHSQEWGDFDKIKMTIAFNTETNCQATGKHVVMPRLHTKAKPGLLKPCSKLRPKPRPK